MYNTQLPLSPPLTPLGTDPPILKGQIRHNATGFFPALKTVSAKPLANASDCIRPNDITVAVIGVGYVGMHLVTAFASRFKVIAYDINPTRVAEVEGQLQGLPVYCTADITQLSSATHFLVAVTTVLHPDKSVDGRWLQKAIDALGSYARPGSTVVIESSVAVGMSRQLLGPIMRAKSLKGGFSPERVDPGRKGSYEAIPKIIAGLDDICPGSLDQIHALYSEVFPHLVPVSSVEVAEMTKLYENCQRMMCIAYANEMADACNDLGIDAREVASAAASKPFGYMPYDAGLGVGGHCIPVNPYYLFSTSEFPLLRAATETMWARPASIGGRIMKRLMETRNNSSVLPRVLVVGVGFKRGQSVISNSPGISLMKHLLAEWTVHVEYVDPLVAEDQVPFAPRLNHKTAWNKQTLETFDAIVVAMAQEGLAMEVIDGLEGVIVEDFSASKRRAYIG